MPVHYYIILFVCLLTVYLNACHNVNSKQEITAKEREGMMSMEIHKTQNTKFNQNKWKFYFQESDNTEIMARFELAHKIVLQTEHPKGKIGDASEYLNNWFILRYPKQKSNYPQAVDKNKSDASVFIVDLDAGKVVARHDVQTIFPIYQQLLQNIIDNPTKQERYIKRMATLTSIVAFGHERYDNPELDFGLHITDVAKLRYEITPTDNSVIYKHCELVIHQNTVKLNVIEQPHE